MSNQVKKKAFSKKFWLLTDEEYKNLKEKGAHVPPDVDLSYLRSQLTKDRIANQIESDNTWNHLTEKIQPLLQARALMPPASAVSSSAAPAAPTAPAAPFITSEPPRLETPPRLQTLQEESAGDEGEETEEDDDFKTPIKTRGAVGSASELNSILASVSRQNQPLVQRLYELLITDPRIYIDSNHVFVDGIRCRGGSAELLENLVKGNKTLSIKGNTFLYKELAQIPQIEMRVNNQEALKLISKFRTPSPLSNRRLSQQGLRDFVREQGLNPLDETLLADWGGDFQKGSGKLTKRRKISWQSLF